MGTLALVTEEYIEDIADAIRSKNGKTDTYTPAEMAVAISAIETGGIKPSGSLNITSEGTHDVTSYASAVVDISSNTTATADDVLTGKTAVSGGTAITGTMADHGVYTGVITDKSELKTLEAGYYAEGSAVSISSDETSKIIPENIKSGVSILGVEGTLEAGSGGSGSVTKYNVSIDNILGDVDSTGTLQKPTETFDISFDGVKDIGDNVLQYKFYPNQAVRNVKFPDLETVSGNYALQYCFYESSANIGTGLLTNYSFPKLKTVTGSRAFENAFYNCGSLTKVVFPELVSVTGDYAFSAAFAYCDSIEDIYLPKLETIDATNAFANTFNNSGNSNDLLPDSVTFPALTSIAGDSCFFSCFQNTPIKNVYFPVLKTIGKATRTSVYDYGIFNYAFAGSNVTSLEFPELEEIYITLTSGNSTFSYNTTLTSMSFPKLKTITYSPAYTGDTSSLKGHINIFSGCTNLKELHFGAENQAAIEATDGYPMLWGLGAGNATVYFDL